MFVSFMLLLLDVFINKVYYSSIVSAVSFINFAFFYYQAKYKNRFKKLVNPFITILIIIISVGWFAGAGGINITNVLVFLLFLLLVIIISPTTSRPFFLVLIFIILVIFICWEYFYPPNNIHVINKDKLLLVRAIVTFTTFGFAAYILVFFKNQYDKEREIVKSQNLKLDDSNSEIEAQNEELIQYQEEVMAQRDFIEDKNKILQQQAIELEKANDEIQAINESLEEKVKDRTRKLMNLNNDLDLLVYRSSHDFRRPLTTLMGLNEVARLTIEDKVSRELFDKVNQTALNMDKMLLKFFMLYNINHFQTTYEGNSLAEIVDKIDKTMISRKNNITFNRKIDIKTYYEKDERNSLIEIILENIVENSLIFNSKENMVVDLEIVENEGDLHISLRDNGNGIPFPQHAKVFDMYFRGSTLSTGNGLGLFVAKRAADLLNAPIIINSKEGKHTRFDITFQI